MSSITAELPQTKPASNALCRTILSASADSLGGIKLMPRRTVGSSSQRSKPSFFFALISSRRSAALNSPIVFLLLFSLRFDPGLGARVAESRRRAVDSPQHERHRILFEKGRAVGAERSHRAVGPAPRDATAVEALAESQLRSSHFASATDGHARPAMAAALEPISSTTSASSGRWPCSSQPWIVR